MRVKKKMTGLTMAVLLSLGQGGHAAEVGPEPLMNFTLDEIVVTATRTEHKAKEVPAATQVITEEEIKRSGSNSLRDLFSLETNFFQKRKVRGGGHEVMIRGMDTDKSLILVNGCRLANESSTSLGNANALERINIHNVQRVEVVYGGGCIRPFQRPVRVGSHGRRHQYHYESAGKADGNGGGFAGIYRCE